MFSDAVIFSAQPHLYLGQHPTLDRAQQALALEIHASELYPKELEKFVKLSNARGDVFGWQGNSEEPQMFVGKILCLLERYDLDAAWLIKVWGAVDRSQRPAYSGRYMPVFSTAVGELGMKGTKLG